MEVLVEALEEMLGKFRSSSPRGFVEPVLAFVHAVDWTEPWIGALVAFHLFLLVFILWTRRNTDLQMAIFFLSMFGIYFAQTINSFLARHWQKFSRQPYFDKRGVFISTLWSGPLLVTSMVILVNSLLQMVRLMVKWKRAELKHKARLAQQHKTD
ncbi:transmembrane protein 18-like [Selaginella moellendorffii]|uniref:transmembrane protein 18-like n=1 Tax=Selaginella moellendorffii TaxID=88036 RepID=UPI000D1C62A6|nr:transmembrane protein 18-like [Selaginella moellendorffii]XP_024539251.1 transmembrane protein 18-like [Selaginella moellendorffii]|eukprot:XP_024539250.1 transmembrane protein 18-like [Selaginella moellendorffii]